MTDYFKRIISSLRVSSNKRCLQTCYLHLLFKLVTEDAIELLDIVLGEGIQIGPAETLCQAFCVDAVLLKLQLHESPISTIFLRATVRLHKAVR